MRSKFVYFEPHFSLIEQRHKKASEVTFQIFLGHNWSPSVNESTVNPAGDEICESKRSLSEPSEKSAEKYDEKVVAIQSNSRISNEKDKIEDFMDEVIEEEIKPVLARVRNFYSATRTVISYDSYGTADNSDRFFFTSSKG